MHACLPACIHNNRGKEHNNRGNKYAENGVKQSSTARRRRSPHSDNAPRHADAHLLLTTSSGMDAPTAQNDDASDPQNIVNMLDVLANTLGTQATRVSLACE